MPQKISLEAYRQEAKNQPDQFDAIEQLFAQDPTLIKLDRQIAGQSYSHIWYQDPDTQQKIAIRLANKNVKGYVLGAGAYGRAKYGVDKYGRLYAVKIKYQPIESFFLQNLTELPLLEQQTLLLMASKLIPPGTFTVVDRRLYFKGESHQPLKEVPPPQENPELETIYIDIKQIIPQLASKKPIQTGTEWTTNLIKLLVASDIELSEDPLNISEEPVSEATIAHDVGLAYGEKTQRQTQSVILEVGTVLDAALEYGKLYLREDQHKIGYKLRRADDAIIRRRMDLPWPTSLEAMESLKSYIIAFARAKGDVPAKDTSALLTGSKQYQVLQLGELTLEDALTKNALDLEEKVSITRRLLWECSKLHTGKLSRSHQAYIHCDLKPGNILLNPSKKNIFLIDFGLSVSANTKGTLHATSWYAPVVVGTDSIHSRHENFDREYATRVQGLGTGFDVFSLKRIIRMPQHSKSWRCIFNHGEWNRLPSKLKEGIEIADDRTSTNQAVGAIRQNNETALDLAMRFIAMEAVDLTVSETVQANRYQANIKELTSVKMTPERQEMVCECAELIDLIQSHNPVQTANSQQVIFAAVTNKDPTALLVLKANLLKQSCLALLDSNIADHPAWHSLLALLDPYSVDQIHRLLPLLNTLYQTIKAAAYAPDKIGPLKELFSSVKKVVAEQHPRPDSSMSASSDEENDFDFVSVASRSVSEVTTSEASSPGGDSSTFFYFSPEGDAFQVSEIDSSNNEGSVNASSKQAIKSRLSSIKSIWTPCLWVDQVSVEDPSTLYIKTIQGNQQARVQIQCMVCDESQIDDVRIVTIDPKELGLTTPLSCPLSKSDFETIIVPELDSIAAKLEADKPKNKF